MLANIKTFAEAAAAVLRDIAGEADDDLRFVLASDPAKRRAQLRQVGSTRGPLDEGMCVSLLRLLTPLASTSPLS